MRPTRRYHYGVQAGLVFLMAESAEDAGTAAVDLAGGATVGAMDLAEDGDWAGVGWACGAGIRSFLIRGGAGPRRATATMDIPVIIYMVTRRAATMLLTIIRLRPRNKTINTIRGIKALPTATGSPPMGRARRPRKTPQTFPFRFLFT